MHTVPPNGFKERKNVFWKQKHTEVLNNVASTTTDGKTAGKVKNDILGADPVVELASQANTEDLGGLELPWSTNESLNSISTADTDSNGSQTTSVGRVAVGSEHHETGDGVVLEDGLVNDTSTGRPKVNTVLLASRLEEVENFVVGGDTGLQVLIGTLGSHNQVVAVDTGRNNGLGKVAGHELQEGHLGGGILHVYTVGLELEVGLAADVTAAVGVGEERLFDIVEVGVEDLLGQGQALRTQHTADLGILVVEGLISGRKNAGVVGGGGRKGAGRSACDARGELLGLNCPLRERTTC